MTKEQKILLVVGGLAALLILAGVSYISILKPFLMTWEGFSSTPYWDVKQWSWGYGTKVPGSTNNPGINPGGTITRDAAMQQLLNHSNNDYLYLKPMLHVPLNANQWAAYLSFAYNLGTGNADNLINNINNQNWSALEYQWKQYINADGVPNSNLIARRNAEWELFTT